MSPKLFPMFMVPHSYVFSYVKAYATLIDYFCLSQLEANLRVMYIKLIFNLESPT